MRRLRRSYNNPNIVGVNGNKTANKSSSSLFANLGHPHLLLHYYLLLDTYFAGRNHRCLTLKSRKPCVVPQIYRAFELCYHPKQVWYIFKRLQYSRQHIGEREREKERVSLSLLSCASTPPPPPTLIDDARGFISGRGKRCCYSVSEGPGCQRHARGSQSTVALLI